MSPRSAMRKTAYSTGVKYAADKLALDAQTLHNILELGGLGLLAVPVAHHLATAEDTGDKVLAGTELAGLGALATPTILKMRGH